MEWRLAVSCFTPTNIFLLHIPVQCMRFWFAPLSEVGLGITSICTLFACSFSYPASHLWCVHDTLQDSPLVDFYLFQRTCLVYLIFNGSLLLPSQYVAACRLLLVLCIFCSISTGVFDNFQYTYMILWSRTVVVAVPLLLIDCLHCKSQSCTIGGDKNSLKVFASSNLVPNISGTFILLL